jgi:hydroxymethylglutaryl-CoA reductase
MKREMKNAVFLVGGDTRLTPDTLPRMKARLQMLQDQTRPLWGLRKPAEMIAHLRRNVEVALGEVEVKDGSTLLSRTVLRWYVFNSGIPWAKGKIHAPKVMSPPPDRDFEEERERLFATMERFVDAAAKEPQRRTVHPFFGPVKLPYWSRMLGMHIEYHLTQFGV